MLQLTPTSTIGFGLLGGVCIELLLLIQIAWLRSNYLENLRISAFLAGEMARVLLAVAVTAGAWSLGGVDDAASAFLLGFSTPLLVERLFGLPVERVLPQRPPLQAQDAPAETISPPASLASHGLDDALIDLRKPDTSPSGEDVAADDKVPWRRLDMTYRARQ